MHEQRPSPSPGPQWPAALGPARCRAASSADVLITPARPFARALSSLSCVLLLAVLALAFDLRLPAAAAAASNLRPVDLQRPGGLAIRSANTSASLLEVLQVDPPVLAPAQATCQQTLMVHVFAYSYGDPFVGSYVPPACDFNRVTFNLTVTSRGRQFDRLALMYFNDTEIFRTSTAEPTANGIIWTYIKDMSAYLSMFRETQKIIFDLGNLIDDTYTGSFNTTLTATFYADTESSFAPADLILPISARKSATDGASAFNLPTDNASSTLTLPQNVERAVFSILAVGQQTEEFWWANVLSSDVSAFGNVTSLYGFSPWREVQLYIDGALAGVAWPFPIIFTGGVAPGFWRPIVGVDAFDLKEDEVDITPWLPVLSDGLDHVFEIRVTGLNDTETGEATLSGTVGSYWVVTGKLFLWLSEDPSSITTGAKPTVSAPEPTIVVSSTAGGSGPNGTNATLDYTVTVSRSFSVSGIVVTANGPQAASWSQTLTYSNRGMFSDTGNVQVNGLKTTGLDIASANQSITTFERTFSYPLHVYSKYGTSGSNYSINAAFDRGKYVSTTGTSAFPLGLEHYNTNATGTTLADHQNGTATYLSVSSPSAQSFSSGSTEQDLTFSGITGLSDNGGDDERAQLLYHRHITATNGSVTSDEQELIGGSADDDDSSSAQTAWTLPAGVQPDILMRGYGVKSVEAVLGRGPAAGGFAPSHPSSFPASSVSSQLERAAGAASSELRKKTKRSPSAAGAP